MHKKYKKRINIKQSTKNSEKKHNGIGSKNIIIAVIRSHKSAEITLIKHQNRTVHKK